MHENDMPNIKAFQNSFDSGTILVKSIRTGETKVLSVPPKSVGRSPLRLVHREAHIESTPEKKIDDTNADIMIRLSDE